MINAADRFFEALITCGAKLAILLALVACRDQNTERLDETPRKNSIAASTAFDEPAMAATLVIDEVTILDGRGGAAIENARVFIRGDRILRVSRFADSSVALPRTLPQDDSATPDTKSAQVVRGKGKFLLPGFIDMHAHLLFPRCTNTADHASFDRNLSERALAMQLEFGVTTVRSPATPTREGLRLRDDLNSGAVRGPRAFASAELINAADASDATLRQTVRDALPYRPDYFKAYARLAPAQVASVIQESHRHHVQVIGHLQRTSWAQGVALGIDHLAHSVDWSLDSLPIAERAAYLQATKTRSGFRARIDWLEAFDPQAPAQKLLLSTLAQKRVSVDVTLMALEKFQPETTRKASQSRYLHAFPELLDDWRSCKSATADWTASDFQRWQAARPKLHAWIKQMQDSGVLLVSGTDLSHEWIVPGWALHHEFERLFEAGLSVDQILRMTGANAAEALHRHDIGVIEAGRLADLVLLSTDPRRDIRNTTSIEWVMQGGRIVAIPRLRARQAK